MDALIWSAVLVAVAACVWMLPSWRLRRALRSPMTPEAIAILERNIAVYPRLDPALQQQLRTLVLQFLHQKKFVGCDGLVVTDEMRLTIAAQACLLLLNRFTRVYPALHTILLYPSAFLVPRNQVDAAGVVTETRQDLLGESWSDGRVVLSWDHVRRGAADWRDDQNVLHRFQRSASSNASSVRSATGAWLLAPPALLTRMSTLPKRATASSMARSQPSRCLASASTNSVSSG